MSIRRYTRNRGSKHASGGRFGQLENIWKRASLRRGLLIALLIALLAGGSWTAWVLKDVPSPETLDEQFVAESTKIYDRTGTNSLYEFGQVKRTQIPLSKISEHMIKATVAAEDQNFYEHHGLNFRGITRALWVNIRGGSLQGGSSITQQLVKNTILTPERTMTRKVREAMLALEIERRFNKGEIMEMYLNIIPYGSNAHGVEAAAQTYFQTSATDLSIAQAALLASLPKAPTYYSPYGSHAEDLFARQKSIINAMAEMGHITQEEAKNAKATKLAFRERADRIEAPHFVFYVKEQLGKEFSEAVIERGGLKVTTTLNPTMQKAAEEAVAGQKAEILKHNAHNAALIAIDPNNGDVLAMVGSVDYFDKENDGNVNVAIRNRSPGSSFKPIVYAQAFRKGYTPGTMLADVPINFGSGEKSYTPGNYTGEFSGPVSMREALARSLNVPAVQALYLADLHDTLNLARKMGFTTLNDPERYGLSLVLGGGEVRLIDSVSAYGVFATEGMKHPHRTILKVEDASGRVLIDNTEGEPEEEKVLDAEIARKITDILSDNAARAPAFGARSPLQMGERPVAAKTGTAQEYRDGWTIGYTPSLVAGVWVGNNDNTPMKRGPGVQTAAPIWNSFMRKVLSGTPVEKFSQPRQEKTHKEVLNGKLPEKVLKYERETNTILPEDCPVPIGKKTKFTEFHSILYYVFKDEPRGDYPKNPEQDPMFAKWEAGVAAWRDKWNKEHKDKNEMYVVEIPDVACDEELLEGRPEINFLSPEDKIARESPVYITVDISAPAEIAKVEFFANDRKIAEKKEEPWETQYKFAEHESGRVNLKVRAETRDGKINQASRIILINPDSGAPEINLLVPRNGETISRNQFPYHIKVDAKDPSGVHIVDVLYRKEGSEHTERAGRTDKAFPEDGNRYEMVWLDAPDTGSYQLWVTATDNTGNKARLSPISLNIE